MPDNTTKGQQRVRTRISLAASILLGITLLFAGSGKLIGFGEMPGQALEFLDAIIPDVLLTPAVASFIGNVFLPYIVPSVEVCLGILLILSIWPRLIALFSLFLSIIFMSSNFWLIRRGTEEFPSCECFGIWEKMFGTLTPLQALYIDIVLFALALTIIFVHPGGFLSSPPWAVKLKEKRKGAKHQNNQAGLR